MKAQIWQLGNTLMNLANCCWPEPDHEQLLYHRVSYFIFRTAFVKLRYLNSELIRRVIDFDDISAMARESRVEATDIPRPATAEVWSDNSFYEDDALEPNPWSVALERCAERLRDFAKATEEETGKAPDAKVTYAEATRLLSIFCSLKLKDRVLIEMLSAQDFLTKELSAHLQDVAVAVSGCSFASTSPLHKIGALAWLCTRSKVAEGISKRFPMYLKTMVDPDDEEADNLIEQAVIKGWYTEVGIAEANYPVSTNPIKLEDVAALKKRCDVLIEWLDTESLEDDDDGEEGK